MKKILMVLFLIFVPALCCADEYVLVKGKGVDVCEAYGSNLNSFGPKGGSMKYKRKINPAYNDFRKPDWLNWDPYAGLPGKIDGAKLFPEDNNDLFDEIDRFIWERDVNPFTFLSGADMKNWHGTKKEYKKAWQSYQGNRQTHVSMPIGQLDIDNDGKMENIVYDEFYERGMFLVLTADKKHIDLKKTAKILQHPPRKTDGVWKFTLDGKIMNDGGHSDYYDAFIYKGKTYFDWFEQECDPIIGRLHVFKTENQKTEEMCIYQTVFYYE
jgi:hypothetical protein